jgi:hypothetical protein
MAKFHIKLKLQGLELEVDGTRDDLPVIREALTQQFAGMLSPATEIAAGEIPVNVAGNGSTPTVVENAKRSKRRARTAPASSNGSSEAAVDWVHDSAKYGAPQQAWNTADKSMWLLYVAGQEANVKELSGKHIEVTFNKHFRQAGQLRANNIIRDLGKAKSAKAGAPALISQNTTTEPSTWFLTDAGSRRAQQLIAESRGVA